MSTEVAPVEATAKVSIALYRLQQACDKDRVIGELKLAVECLGLTVAQIETIVSITNAYQQLNCHDSTAGQSLPLLCAILGEMSVPVKQLSDLKKFTTDKAIRECQKRTDFGFAKMIIKLCNDFSLDDFETFRSLCLGHFDTRVHSSQCPTIVELFQKLIRARKVVWRRSVQVLVEILNEMQKESSLVHVDEYKKLIGIISSPTDVDQGEITFIYNIQCDIPNRVVFISSSVKLLLLQVSLWEGPLRVGLLKIVVILEQVNCACL